MSFSSGRWLGLGLLVLAVHPALAQDDELFAPPTLDEGAGTAGARPRSGSPSTAPEEPTSPPPLAEPIAPGGTRPPPSTQAPAPTAPATEEPEPEGPPPPLAEPGVSPTREQPKPNLLGQVPDAPEPKPEPEPEEGGKHRRRHGRGHKGTPANVATSSAKEGAKDKAGKAPEAEGPLISAVDLVGNRMISKDVIMLSLELKAGDHITQSKLEKDSKALKELGYFAFVAPEVVPNPDESVTVLFKVVENPILREVKVEGATLIPVEELQKNIVVEPGNILNSTQLLESLSRINALYQKKGYAFCGVLSSDQFDMDAQTGILTIRIAEPVLGHIKFMGLKKNRSFVLRREFETKKGRVLKGESLRRSMKNLGRLNYFEEIKPPKPTLSEDLSVVDLEVEVKEQRTGTASAGGGYSSLNGLIGFFDVAETDFRGRGQTVRVKWEFGGQRSYQLDFVEPWLRGKPQSLGLSLFQTRTDRAQYRQATVSNLYVEQRTGFGVNTGWRVAKDTRVTLGFTDEHVSAAATSTTPLPLDLQRLDDNKDGRVEFDQEFLTLGWTKDARDSPFNANEGYRLATSISTTGGFLKGPTGFNRYIVDARKYFPFGHKGKDGKTDWTLATRGKFGFHQVFDGQLNFNDRFALGGSDSLRGYQDREFTGSRFALANLEVRRHLSKLVTVVGFYDLGDAWGLDNEKLDLKGAYGFGLRFVTPIGPFRLDYGIPEEGSGRFHFGIGQQF